LPVAGAEADSAPFPALSAARARWGGAVFAAWGASVVVLLLAMAMTTDVAYDEDQHIAAGVLARHLRPYADFVYFQPPLYPLLLSALFEATDGYYLLAGRTLTWALSVASFAALFHLLLRLGAGRPLSALLVTACIASPFLYGPIANTRNDLLPLCLLLAGLNFYLRADEDRPAAAAAAAGLCFGLAVTARLSYAFGPPVVLLHALLARRGAGPARSRLLPPLVAGLAVAASPGLYYLWIAPEGFLYGLLEYHLTAPIAWYAQEGQAERLLAGDRAVLLGELLLFGGNGTLVVLACLVAAARWLSAPPRAPAAADERRPAPPGASLPVDGLILGLLAGALLFGFLPRPSWPMYYAPVAPLLACFVAAQWRHLRAAAGGPRRRPMLAVAAASALPTALALGPHLGAVAKLPAWGEWAGIAVHRNAVAIRDAVRQAGGGEGDVATLFPTFVIDANPVRAEFASGPFFFRTAGPLPPDRILRLRGTAPEDLERLFAADPPAAIFGGIHGERWRAPLDAALLAYAERHGYALVAQDLAAGGASGGRLYVRRGPSPPRRR
jgi:hypothetical protein